MTGTDGTGPDVIRRAARSRDIFAPYFNLPCQQTALVSCGQTATLCTKCLCPKTAPQSVGARRGVHS